MSHVTQTMLSRSKGQVAGGGGILSGWLAMGPERTRQLIGSGEDSILHH